MKCLTKKISDFTPEQYNKCLSLMTEERRAYLDTVSSKEKKLASVCGEWWVKELTSEITNKSIEEITVLHNKKGKPYLKDLPFHISISHCADLIAVAINESPIGIDTEKIKDRDLKVCRKVCTEKEKEIIENSNNSLEAFYKIWTAKEAYFKKEGTGITNLKAVSYESIDCEHFFEDEYIITVAK